MKQSDPLQLVAQGSLDRPGPVGRSVRLAFGLLCSYALFELVLYRVNIISNPVSVLPSISIMVVVAILIINYVVNIGFGKSFGRWPSYISIAVALLLGTVSWLTFGTPDHPMLGTALWLWLAYFYSHLGVSFLLAAVIATPGCEMRSIPDLYGRVTGRETDEHHCPASFITAIDAWESGRRATPI